MDDLRDILNVLRAFQDGALTPDDFVERYSELWKELVKEQDDAIAQHPTVGRALQELNEQHRYSEITTERYLEKVQEQYALLQGLRLRPGTEASRLLDHVFVEADAYRDDVNEPGGVHATKEELREAVRQALSILSSG